MADGSSAYVRLLGLTKGFEGVPVLSKVSLDVARGEVLTLLGASGSGKSVLLKLLIGLIDADDGRIELDGRDVTDLTEVQRLQLRQKVSMLFQSGALFDSMTVGENVAYPLRVAGGEGEKALQARVRERLKMVGLPGTEDLEPSELSGGMRKRVALARAIAGDPELVLYDEPTSGLDPVTTRRIDELIVSIRDRLHVTSLVVTHDLATAFLISDRVAMLHGGQVVAVLPPRDFARSAEPSVREFLSAMPAFAPEPVP